jgi:hypothetical protein
MRRYDFISCIGLINNAVTCGDMLLGVVTRPIFQFIPGVSMVKLYFLL